MAETLIDIGEDLLAEAATALGTVTTKEADSPDFLVVAVLPTHRMQESAVSAARGGTGSMKSRGSSPADTAIFRISSRSTVGMPPDAERRVPPA